MIQNEKTINYENSINLDSTDAFEGPEKLLEIWLAPSKDFLPAGMAKNGLRAIPQPVWQDILDHVNCKILSVVKTKHMDAFVLSESSLFVFDHKVILKTCGTTTTLAGIKPLQDAISEFAGYPREKQPWRVFYSRKSFMFPELQKHPHQSWSDEVSVLDGYFDNGCAYVVGNLRSDHWYLYATVPLYFDKDLKMPINIPNTTTTSNNNNTTSSNDETLEILMTDLSPVHAGQFFTDRLVPPTAATVRENLNKHHSNSYGDMDSDSSSNSSLDSSVSSLGAAADDDDPGHELGNIVTKMTGIDQIYPTKDQVVDSFCFTPCGYSCNGLVTEGHYFTIHVTPERHCSYASFETNVPANAFGMTNLDVVEKVVNIFRPGRFSVTLFDSDVEQLSSSPKLPVRLNSYRRTEMIRYELNGYDLVFLSFESNKLK